MRLLLSVLLLVLSVPSVAAEAPLRFSVADSWSMPLMQSDINGPRDGFLFDIMQSLSRQVGRKAEYHVLARMRVQSALERGEIDVRCYAAQSWMPNMSGDYLWSPPLMTQRDLLISTADHLAPVHVEQLQDKTIGTVLGYTYPHLQQLFDSHQLQREDARNQELVLQKLQAGRYHYAVGNEWSLNWFNRNLPPERRLHAVSIIEEQAVGCVVRNNADVPTQWILRTLLKMKMSGEIEQIIQRYGADPVPLPVEQFAPAER